MNREKNFYMKLVRFLRESVNEIEDEFDLLDETISSVLTEDTSEKYRSMIDKKRKEIASLRNKIDHESIHAHVEDIMLKIQQKFEDIKKLENLAREAKKHEHDAKERIGDERHGKTIAS